MLYTEKTERDCPIFTYEVTNHQRKLKQGDGEMVCKAFLESLESINFVLLWNRWLQINKIHVLFINFSPGARSDNQKSIKLLVRKVWWKGPEWHRSLKNYQRFNGFNCFLFIFQQVSSHWGNSYRWYSVHKTSQVWLWWYNVPHWYWSTLSLWKVCSCNM